MKAQPRKNVMRVLPRGSGKHERSLRINCPKDVYACALSVDGPVTQAIIAGKLSNQLATLVSEDLCEPPL